MVDQGEVFDLIDNETFKAVVENGELWDISEAFQYHVDWEHIPPVTTMPPEV